MKLNQKGIELIKSFEGLRLESYRCSAGVWTIGYGTTKYHDGRSVKPGDKITSEQAEILFKDDLAKFSRGVIALIKHPMLENPFSALVSLAYNIGLGAFGKSTLLKMLNEGKEYEAVAPQFLRWNKAGGKVINGLTRRREVEMNFFLS
jgi:lysozyme